MQKKNKRHNLDSIREKFRATIEAAARKYDELINSSHTLMPAVYDATRTKSKNAASVFSIDDKHRFREIKREVRRAEKFLKDASTDDYDMLDQRYIKASGADHRFGGEFKAQFGVSYYEPLVDKDFAETTFEIFHKVESDVVKEFYESEQLVNAIYDMVVEEQGFGDAYIEEKRFQLVNYLREKNAQKSIAKDLELLHQDSEYGILEESTSAKDFYLKLSKKYWWRD